MSPHFGVRDVIAFPSGINRERTEGVVLAMHVYDTGDVALRWRYASNERGVDWRGFISAADVPNVEVLGRDESVDLDVRSLLPSP